MTWMHKSCNYMTVIYYLLSADSALGLEQSTGKKTSFCFRSDRVNLLPCYLWKTHQREAQQQNKF